MPFRCAKTKAAYRSLGSGLSLVSYIMARSSGVAWSLNESSGEIQLASEIEPSEDAQTVSSGDTEATSLYEGTQQSSAQVPTDDQSPTSRLRDALVACSVLYSQRQSAILSSLSLHSDDEHKGIGLALRNFSSPEWWSSPVESDADAMAKLCLQAQWAAFVDLVHLIDLLPAGEADLVVSTTVAGPTSSKQICFGAYIFSGCAGLQNTTEQYVWVVRLLCSIIRSIDDEALFSNVFLSFNVPNAPHEDSNNHRGINNILVPLSVWTTVDLEPQGQHMFGKRWRTRAPSSHITSGRAVRLSKASRSYAMGGEQVPPRRFSHPRRLATVLRGYRLS